jgi:methyltransferase (TIGR00027 family)
VKKDQASATARLIAGTVVYGTYAPHGPRPSAASVEACRGFLRADAAGKRFLRSIDSRPGRWLWRHIESALGPGFSVHVARRKLWIEATARRAIEEGYRQVVVIGAGLDALGTVLAREQTASRIIELDHPATQRVKAAALSAAGAAGIELLPVDLSTTTLHEALGVNSARPRLSADDTVVIAEGLLMYMPEEKVALLLGQIASLPVPRIRAVLTFIERIGDRPPEFRPSSALTRVWLKTRGEPFLWGASQGDAGALFARCGLEVKAMRGEDELAELYPSPSPMLRGEVVVEAARDRPPA